MGSFYVSISSKSKVSKASSFEEIGYNENQRIPAPPTFKAPTIRSLSIELNKYDIRTQKFN